MEYTASDESGNIATKIIMIIVSDGAEGYIGYYESINGLADQSLIDEIYTILNNTGTYTTTTYGEARSHLEKNGCMGRT